MSQKHPASSMEDYNNNNNDTLLKTKKRRSMEQPMTDKSQSNQSIIMDLQLSPSSDSNVIIVQMDEKNGTTDVEYNINTYYLMKKFPTSPTDSNNSISSDNNATHKTDSDRQLSLATSNEAIVSNSISESLQFTSVSYGDSLHDEAFLRYSSDEDCCTLSKDCSNDEHLTDNDWHAGQIVWAALQGYSFWPAIVFTCENEQTFRKGKNFHHIVKI